MTEQTRSIWFRPHTLEELNATNAGNMVGFVGIEYTGIGPDHLEARMPVDERTRQPFGLLHGGASMVLAETLGSYGATLTIDPSKRLVVGQEINANHLRAVRDGFVIGTAQPVHLGSRSQVWSIDIRDEAGRLVCTSRMTLAVLDRQAPRNPS